MILQYLKELETLPKGKLLPKSIKGKKYFYLCYRDGKKVISEYIGNDKDKIIKIQERLARRNQVEEILKKLKEEKSKIKKIKEFL